MAVSTAGIAIKDDFPRELGGTADYAVAGADVVDEDEYLLALAEERLKNDSGVTYAAEDVYARLGIEDDETEVEID
jgi:hypothetical protein